MQRAASARRPLCESRGRSTCSYTDESIRGGDRMVLVWIGALLVLGGLVFVAVQPLRRGRLSGEQLRSRHVDTLEPRRPGRGLGLKSSWPGLVLIAVGAIMLLSAVVR